MYNKPTQPSSNRPRRSSTGSGPLQRRVSARSKAARRQARYSRAEQELANAFTTCSTNEMTARGLQIRALHQASELLKTQAKEARTHLDKLLSQLSERSAGFDVQEAARQRWMGEHRIRHVSEEVDGIQQTLRMLEGQMDKPGTGSKQGVGDCGVLAESTNVSGKTATKSSTNLQRFLHSSQRRHIFSMRDLGVRYSISHVDLASRRTLQDISPLRLRPDSTSRLAFSPSLHAPLSGASKIYASMSEFPRRLCESTPNKLVFISDVHHPPTFDLHSRLQGTLTQPPSSVTALSANDTAVISPCTSALCLPHQVEDTDSGLSSSISTSSLPDSEAPTPLPETLTLIKSISAHPLVPETLPIHHPRVTLARTCTSCASLTFTGIMSLPDPLYTGGTAGTVGTATIFRSSSPLTDKSQNEIMATLPPPSSFSAVSDFKSTISSAFLSEPDLSLRQVLTSQQNNQRAKIGRFRSLIRRNGQEEEESSVDSQPQQDDVTLRFHSDTAGLTKTEAKEDVSPFDLPALGLGIGLELGLDLTSRPTGRPMSMYVPGATGSSEKSFMKKLKNRFSLNMGKK